MWESRPPSVFQKLLKEFNFSQRHVLEPANRAVKEILRAITARRHDIHSPSNNMCVSAHAANCNAQLAHQKLADGQYLMRQMEALLYCDLLTCCLLLDAIEHVVV